MVNNSHDDLALLIQAIQNFPFKRDLCRDIGKIFHVKQYSPYLVLRSGKLKTWVISGF